MSDPIMHVDVTGPLFTGATERGVEASLAAIEQTVANRAVNMIHAQLGEVLQNPTGYYESKIRTDRVTEGVSVNDDMVIYGPWLEGVGSRNYPVTRFKGYFTFKLVRQQLNTLAVTDAGRVLLQYLLAVK
jgi:hypothetical protein